MAVKVTRIQRDGFLWIDVAEPNRKVLSELALELSLPPSSLKDALNPEHLPKEERFGEMIFTITRLYDDQCNKDADTVQELTRKIAIFRGANFLLTLHRKDLSFIAHLRDKFSQAVPFNRVILFSEMLLGIVSSYQKPLELALEELEQLETQIFKDDSSSNLIETGYYLKRRASVFKRILKLTYDVILKFQSNALEDERIFLKEALEEVQHHLFYAEELVDNVHNILNLHLSISSQKTNSASHQTNEVMRVLTMFSVILMPLNLIAGIYGMNFKFIPELDLKYGYPLVLSLMIVVSYVTYKGFKRKGWIR